MALLVPCPGCGNREVFEFAYGGESNRRPPPGAPPADLARYLFFRRNVAGIQVEWWYHRDGCQRWFLARRDTRSNLVAETYWPEDRALRKA
ncbi:MAG TPA: sarcosine oxidase subunit delta [Candidatus Dormibacteraeota bacterium]|jgi:sarcosine oxidase subunit delta